jgi:phospholipid N-methyltransferase
MATRIDEATLAILSRCSVSGNLIVLPEGQLDRKQYLAVNKVLENMGGKWDRKLKAHVYPEDPTEKFENIMLTGEIVQPEKFGYFPTPPELAKRVVNLAEIEHGHMVLEPSAGQGALVDQLLHPEYVTCIELLEENVKVLESKHYDVVQTDFLGLEPREFFDRIIMNPPFEKQADIDHVMRACGHLKPGGRLVAIMASGITFRENKKTVNCRDFINQYGRIEPNPEGSFKVSGTMVNTVTVIIDKPEDV